ncbi:HNH endonuclease signature motif containing protein [Arthrobacter alkaliphilus]|uniref:HNH endonuclease signature motif containing protein n=1 Tax=Arthrobacter alkaliphilus TaxID=369936 RepID=UPI001F359776|nr:HNH endonuclease signature motif containing protein [Arthrobacter alkaliphilus]
MAAVRSLSGKAADDVGVLGFQEAVAFADAVEELSRTLDYLQVVAASALDAARNEEHTSRPGRTSSWAAETEAGWGAGWTSGSAAGPEGAQDSGAGSVHPDAVHSVQARGGDRGAEFRSTAEHLRSLLRISAAEARRRLALARELLPGRGLTGQAVRPRHEETAAALASGAIGSRSAGIITMAVEKVRPMCSPEKAAEVERALARTAEENDQDFLSRVARRWVEAIDQDGPEPSEESLRYHQGAFLRRPRHGLQHVEIFATTEQYEHLLTVMNTATNPRIGAPRGTDPSAGEPSAQLDRRSRAQKLLDGLVGACKLALAAGYLPATGGHRPHILAIINHTELFSSRDHQEPGEPAVLGTGSFTFTGPVPAAALRKLACDADIIPVVLGGESQVLDIGRASRIFPPQIRKAITARDKGCAFPGCTMPAPWCEAHHIEYWSRGGATSTGNGTLLCSHHHHLIHKEDWHIQVNDGIPWFIPPPHIDPHRKPRRNQYFQL